MEKDENKKNKRIIIILLLLLFLLGLFIKKMNTSTYTLTIDTNYNTSKSAKKVEIESGDTYEIDDPEREGYVFDGWEIEGKKSKVKKDIFTMGKENTTLTAKWKLKSYKISYELNGGTVKNKEDYTIKTETFTLSNPTKLGYEFSGWTGTDIKELSKEVTIEQGTTGNKEYKANWKLNTYDITYDLNGGYLNKENPSKYTIETETFTLNNPIKKDYIFTGWSEINDKNINKNLSVKKGNTGNKTYIANWTPVPYSINYNLNGGSLDKYAIKSYTAQHKTFNLPTPTKRGYIFDGWYLNEQLTGTKQIQILKGTKGNKKYYAKWKLATYTIKYNLNGGTQEKTYPATYTINTETFKVDNPTKEDYVFSGWTETNEKTPIKNLIVQKGTTGNKVYIANWIPETYNIDYVLNGGKLNKNAKKTYTIETKTFNLPTPTRQAYTFEGWYELEDLSGNAITSIAKGTKGNKKYYAKWKAIEYSITYNLNEGTQATDAKTTYTIETESFALPLPTKKGYQFKGWYTNNKLTGKNVNEIELGTYGNKTYYAKWEKYKNYAGYTVHNMVKDNYSLDNTNSLFVNNKNGIDFKKTSSLSNGLGIYMIASTKNDKYPIYYYRGKVENNNMIMSGICWKVVRTTETGGVKLAYNGLPVNGECNNTGPATQIGTSKYNTSYNLLESAGYSYADKTHKYNYFTNAKVKSGYVFANDVEYVNGEYILKDKYIADENFVANREEVIKNHHYTCLKDENGTCTSVYFIFMTRDNAISYITLTNGETIESVLNDSITNSSNTKKSAVRTTVDKWYENNMKSNTKYLEDTIWCNDRSIYSYGGWDKNSSTVDKLTYSSIARISILGTPSVNCKNKADSFTVSTANGNGKLEYPVGLLTADEAALSGYAWYISDPASYLNSDKIWWTMSPSLISATYTYIGVVYSMIDNVHTAYTSNGAGGVRPSVSLKNEIIIKDGDGTSENPFIIVE